jgi:hypothetical protein
MTQTIHSPLKSKLYETDYYLWIETTIKQLQDKDLNNLDWSHLVEEIEALGIEQKRKVESYLKQLLIHLLLCRYWETEKAACQRGWHIEIGNFRDELEFSLRSKTLYNYFLTCLEPVYAKARRSAIQKTGLQPDTFPKECPFSIENILDDEYLP